MQSLRRRETSLREELQLRETALREELEAKEAENNALREKMNKFQLQQQEARKVRFDGIKEKVKKG